MLNVLYQGVQDGYAKWDDCCNNQTLLIVATTTHFDWMGLKVLHLTCCYMTKIIFLIVWSSGMIICLIGHVCDMS